MNALSKPGSELGFWRATALVTGNIVGSGIFMLPASLGLYGSVGFVGWLITSTGAISLALVFASLSRRFPKTGGPYAYCKEAFGEFVGFQMAWSYWVGTWASNAAISTAFVSYLTVFFPSLYTNMPLAFLIACGSVWFFTLINVIGVRSVGIMQIFIALVKVIPLVIIGIFGVFHFKLDHFVPFNPSGEPMFNAIASSAALTLFAFLGIESATIPAENVRNPEKTIPRATVVGTVIAAGIYLWTTLILLGVLSPQELSASTAPFADASAQIFGPWAVPIVGACAAFAAFGTLNGWILLQGQMPFAAARDGLFPHAFTRLTKSGVPFIGVIGSSVLMTLMLFMNYRPNLVNQFTAIVSFTTFAVLLPYLYSALAEMLMVFNDPKAVGMSRIKSFSIAFIAFLYSLIIVAGSGSDAVYMGSIFLFAGFPLYVFMKRFDNKVQ